MHCTPHNQTLLEEVMQYTTALNEPSLITKHAQIRMQQRSISNEDVLVILNHGTSFDDNSIILTRKDVEHTMDRFMCDLKKVEREIKSRNPTERSTNFSKTNNDQKRFIAQQRKTMQRIQRLQDYKVVMDGDTLITCYRCSQKSIKRAYKHFH
jgi:hypothetical protein